MLLTAFVALTLWLAWVPSGLANRSMGAIAENWARDALQKTPEVFWTIPSWKYDKTDVDLVALVHGTFLAIEVKWTSRKDVDEGRVNTPLGRLGGAPGDCATSSTAWNCRWQRYRSCPSSLSTGPSLDVRTIGPISVNGEAVSVCHEDTLLELVAMIRRSGRAWITPTSFGANLELVASERDQYGFAGGRLLRFLSRA